MEKADLIIYNAAQLLTCASPNGPKRGPALADVGLIENGAVAIRDGRILATGKSDDILRSYEASWLEDASGRVVCPGFVDCHTHLVYAGSRAHEFEMRIQGKSYMDILAAGGGIVSTMRETRRASAQDLLALAAMRLKELTRFGTTTVEIKTGYGLDTPTEMKLLEVIEQLARDYPITIIPTFLGAHVVPPEYQGCADDYVRLVIEEMLPAAQAWYRQSVFAQREIAFFVDVFCEAGVFDVGQARRILEAGKQLGMGIKAHVDEFQRLGGVTMALGLGAVSVDHLDVTSQAEISALATMPTIAVIMSAVNFNLGGGHYADARAMIDAGCAVALATDMNPGSAPCPSLPMVMAIACRYQKLLPSEALNACTINAAYAVGMGDRLGSLEAGKWADVLLLNTSDYREIAHQFGGNLVNEVIKHGVKILDLWNP